MEYIVGFGIVSLGIVSLGIWAFYNYSGYKISFDIRTLINLE